MPKLSLAETASHAPHALLFAPRSGGVEVAAYVTRAGDQVMSNANITPYAPDDGTPMQVAGSKRVTLKAEALRSMVGVGRCTACDNSLIATASLAEAIDVAGVDVHCPFCSNLVTATIDSRQLIKALAEEYDDDDDVGDDGGEGDMGDESEGDGGDMSDDADTEMSDGDGDGGDDPDMPEDDSDGETGDGGETSDGGDYDDGDGDGDYDDGEADDPDDGESGDGGEEDDPDDETAGVLRSLRRKARRPATAATKKVVKKGKPVKKLTAASDCDEDDEEEDASQAEFASVVRELRKKVVALGMDSDCEDEGEDDEVAAAATHLRRRARAQAHVDGERPVAGKGVDRADIANMNDGARAALRERRGDRPDGNAHLKSPSALAADTTVGEDSKTPGTNATEGEENRQLDTPGSNRTPPENPDSQEVTPGTTETSGDLLVDWAAEKIELVSTSDADARWVFAGGRPVARLVRQKASAGVAAQWSNADALARAFQVVCSRGLPMAEAGEFGYEPHAFRVEASDVMRRAMRRQSQLATENAQLEVARNVERYKQSLRTAVVAVLKNVYPDTQNPMREALVASLVRLSVAEPRGVVDAAMMTSVEPFVVSVLAKADEIATKSDDGRNEVANIVATATYQSRTDQGAALAATLAGNAGRIIPGGIRSPVQLVERASSSEEDMSTFVRRALIARR